MKPRPVTAEKIKELDVLMSKFGFAPAQTFFNGRYKRKLVRQILGEHIDTYIHVDISALEHTEANIVREIMLASFKMGAHKKTREIKEVLELI